MWVREGVHDSPVHVPFVLRTSLDVNLKSTNYATPTYLSSLSFSLFRVESASNSVRCSPTRCLHCSSRVALGGCEGEGVCMCGVCVCVNR